MQNFWNRFVLFAQSNLGWFARIALFVIYFWFGFLKVVGLSPASALVTHLLAKTLPFADPTAFLVVFGLFECAIGTLFLISGFERIAVPLFFAHMAMTFGPFVLLPREVFASFGAPTLEGQYIVKNLALIGCALAVAAGTKPRDRS